MKRTTLLMNILWIVVGSFMASIWFFILMIYWVTGTLHAGPIDISIAGICAILIGVATASSGWGVLRKGSK